jgi:tetratricopeptide (TPR) repeat protein
LNDRGNAWSDIKQYEKAIKDYDQAIRLDAKFTNAFICRAIAWGKRKEYDKAIQDYNEAIRLEPKSAYGYGNRAQAWAKQKQYDKAVKDFDEAMRLDPMDWVQRNYAFFRATCREEKYRDGKKAIVLAKKAIKLASMDANWEYSAALAAAYAEAGEFDKAVQQQTKALEDKSIDKEDRAKMEERLKLYRDKKPYRATE